MASKVFISHSQKDKNVANALCHKLEEDGIRCWIAPRDIAGGANWAESIVNALCESAVFVLIFSSNANKSNQVIREVEMAINHGIVLIPLRIEDVMPTGSMSYYLSATHWIDAVNSKMGSKFQLISDRIKSLLEQNELDHPESQAPNQDEKEKDNRARETKTAEKIRWFRKKPLIIVAAVLIVAAVAAAAVFLPGLFGERKQDVEINPTPMDSTPAIAIETKPDAVAAEPAIHFDDAGLENAICKTLAAKGEYADGQPLTQELLLKLDYLVIMPEDSVAAFRDRLLGDDTVAEFDSRLFTTNDIIFSLSGLEFATNLNQIIIINSNIRDITPLAELPNLQKLHLDGNSIRDFSSLSRAYMLGELHASDNLVDDASFLTELKGLRSLDLSNNNISDISALKQLSSLEILSLASNNISDISVFQSMNYLSSLDLSDNKITDISSLSSLRKLTSLYLAQNDISDISPLEKMNALEWLDLSGNTGIKDISVMPQFGSLKGLWLENCGLTDIAPLKDCNDFWVLSLSNNNIVDLNPLKNKAINELSIVGNLNIDGSIAALLSLGEFKTLYIEVDLYNRYFNEVFKDLKDRGVLIVDANGAEFPDQQ